MMNQEQITRAFLRHREVILSFVRALVRNSHDADELFQEIGVRVLRMQEVPVSEAEFPAWCRGVARKVVLHYWRAQRRNRVVPNTQLVEVIEQAYQEAEQREELTRIRSAALSECLELLPEQKRTVLQLRFYEGMTSEQISSVTARTAEAVRKELSRLYGQLLECVRRRVMWEDSHVV